jgi:hypothetical protein
MLVYVTQHEIDKILHRKTLETGGESGRCRMIGMIIDNRDDGSQFLLQIFVILLVLNGCLGTVNTPSQHELKITHLHDINDT